MRGSINNFIPQFCPPTFRDGALTKNCLPIFYKAHTLFELADPVSAHGTISAKTAEVASNRSQLGQDVSEMNTLLEVIAPTIWQNPIIQDMHFAHDPRVESWLREYFVE